MLTAAYFTTKFSLISGLGGWIPRCLPNAVARNYVM